MPMIASAVTLAGGYPLTGTADTGRATTRAARKPMPGLGARAGPRAVPRPIAQSRAGNSSAQGHVRQRGADRQPCQDSAGG